MSGLKLHTALPNAYYIVQCINKFFSIETEFEVKTRTIAADFSTGPKAIEIVRQELGDLPIGILGKLQYLFL